LAIQIRTPVTLDIIRQLKVGDQLQISGIIYNGRDAALPLLVKAVKENRAGAIPVKLEGGVIFHSAVSIAGVGPTTSNKVEIEESISVLSEAGVRIHIGKGGISAGTVKALLEFHSIFAVTPPISALLTQTIISRKVVAFPEEGIEAIHELKVEKFPVIVAVCDGNSIYER
jgi:fumarate hydratase subunit beta